MCLALSTTIVYNNTNDNTHWKKPIKTQEEKNLYAILVKKTIVVV